MTWKVTEETRCCHLKVIMRRELLSIQGIKYLPFPIIRETDVTLPDIAMFCDVFYIGGTKVGALCGEAVVFTKNNVPKHFMTRVKQHGALVAKGRLLGVQFVVVENSKLQELGEKVNYSFWELYDENHTVIRLATSWSTTEADIEALREIL